MPQEDEQAHSASGLTTFHTPGHHTEVVHAVSTWAHISLYGVIGMACGDVAPLNEQEGRFQGIRPSLPQNSGEGDRQLTPVLCAAPSCVCRESLLYSVTISQCSIKPDHIGLLVKAF